MTNCTFTGNLASNGSSLACIPEFADGSTNDVTATNSILWDGGNAVWSNHNSGITISYSNVRRAGRLPWPREGNIRTDPLFADPDNGDFHLKSQAGRWDSLTETWVTDDVISLRIDAGDPNSPVSFEALPNGGRINMGAYGGTAEASRSR